MLRTGYLALLRRRPALRRLWLGSVVSLAGDWFTLIALYSLLLEYTGQAGSVGLMLAARFLSPALLSPLAGVVADRLDRRRVMVACDLLRAAVVACFPLVSSASEVWLVYVLTVLQMGVGAFFEPAEAAAIGSVVEPGEVVTATALQATTWSVMLGFGAMTGGFLTAAFGRTASFLVDAASYLASALLILGARVPSLPPGEARVGWRAWTGADDFRAGLRLVARQPGLKRLVWVKSGWALAGGAAILLYAVLGEREFQVAGSAEAGIGLLLGMRGVGALLGPLVARRVGGDEPRFLERAIGLGYLVTAVAWLGFAASPTWWLAAAFLAAAHTGASVQWSFSSALITLSVEDRFRGRAFSLDMMAQLVLLAASSSLGGWLLDQGAVSPRWLMAGCSAVLLAAGAAWAYGSGPEKTPSQASPGGVPR